MTTHPFQPPPPSPQPFQPPPQPPVKHKRFGWLALALAVVAALTVGAFVAGGGDGVDTASPAPAATRTVTQQPDAAPTEEPSDEPTEEPTKTYVPKKSDFEITLNQKSKRCFGDYGCNITIKVELAADKSKLPDEGVVEISYKIHGDEDGAIEGTIELQPDGTFYSSEEFVSTPSKATKLRAEITKVDYNEFG